MYILYILFTSWIILSTSLGAENLAIEQHISISIPSTIEINTLPPNYKITETVKFSLKDLYDFIAFSEWAFQTITKFQNTTIETEQSWKIEGAGYFNGSIDTTRMKSSTEIFQLHSTPIILSPLTTGPGKFFSHIPTQTSEHTSIIGIKFLIPGCILRSQPGSIASDSEIYLVREISTNEFRHYDTLPNDQEIAEIVKEITQHYEDITTEKAKKTGCCNFTSPFKNALVGCITAACSIAGCALMFLL